MMVTLRSRRLEALFGVALDRIEAHHLDGLVAAGIQESFDLDFKAEHYGNGDSKRRELAGDVAAMANTAGGLIVIGVEEDDQARAVAAPGVPVTDAEIRRVQQIVAALVSPVPVFDVLAIIKPVDEHGDNQPTEEPLAEGGHPEVERSDVDVAQAPVVGFVVIAVARSALGPHAVLINDALRFPRRNGSTTRYLSEPELAAAYRDRFAGEQARVHRLDAIERDALRRLDTEELSWVVVSLVPDLPGDFTISSKVFREFEQSVVNRRVDILRSSTFTRAGVGLRSLQADGGRHDSPQARWCALDLHTDGSGVYALAVDDLTTRRQTWQLSADESGAAPVVQLVDDEAIALAILSGLGELARHARDRAATGGGVLLRARLHPVDADRPTQIGHTRNSGGSRSRHSLVDPPLPAETSATVDDLAVVGPELVAVASRLADELGQAFGVPEMGQLTATGEVRRRFWSQQVQPHIGAWAEANGISVSDETLRE